MVFYEVQVQVVSFQSEGGPWDVEVNSWRGTTGFNRGKAVSSH